MTTSLAVFVSKHAQYAKTAPMRTAQRVPRDTTSSRIPICVNNANLRELHAQIASAIIAPAA